MTSVILDPRTCSCLTEHKDPFAIFLFKKGRWDRVAGGRRAAEKTNSSGPGSGCDQNLTFRSACLVQGEAEWGRVFAATLLCRWPFAQVMWLRVWGTLEPEGSGSLSGRATHHESLAQLPTPEGLCCLIYKMGDTNILYLPWLLQGLNEIMNGKWVAKCLAFSKPSIPGIIITVIISNPPTSASSRITYHPSHTTIIRSTCLLIVGKKSI